MNKNDYCCYVYIIKNDNCYKIGYSNNPEKRCKTLSSGSPNKLEIVYARPYYKNRDARRDEQILHRIFMDYRKNGEWFELDKYMKKLLFRLIKTKNNFEDILLLPCLYPGSYYESLITPNLGYLK